jgi:exosome complex component RRP4
MPQEIDFSTREAISRVTNIIKVLAAHHVPLSDSTLVEAYDWTVDHEGGVSNLTQDDLGEALVAAICNRR